MNLLRREAGFTLIELMIVVTILAIVMAIGIPSFTTMIKNNRLTAAVNDLAGALHFARAEAVRRGRSVQVQALNNDIANGLRVWFDTNSNSSFNDGEEMRVVRLAGTSGITATAGVTNLNMTYSARGSVSGAGNELKITLCDDRSGSHGKELRLLASGMLRTSSGVACN
ncbi:GspH/FimT family pseudopilin [Microbulbifer pacificus]|uniref:Type II secretion system protein H n=1 Tax=Microbulbifer pacificus TaxID=407164 RepID=A0AAU0N351_9GAMM|nr:GspH/FimT family pseudopilin [Microbulbifer pacificus]WOX06688.1 GspH/FimT family pseudopilin [Microbulbifer pacificus]